MQTDDAKNLSDPGVDESSNTDRQCPRHSEFKMPPTGELAEASCVERADDQASVDDSTDQAA